MMVMKDFKIYYLISCEYIYMHLSPNWNVHKKLI